MDWNECGRNRNERNGLLDGMDIWNGEGGVVSVACVVGKGPW